MRLPCNVRVIFSRSSIVMAAILLAFAAAPPALADPPSCQSDTRYDVRQVSLDGDYIEIISGITDPAVSTLYGDDSNKDNHSHILLWDGIVEESLPSGQHCGDEVYAKCWLQAGVGMGWIDTSLGHDFNDTNSYEPYAEWYGIDDQYYVHFFNGISVNENSSPHVLVEWSGAGNTFIAEARDSSDTWHILYTGDLYYAAAHAAAHSEVYNGDGTTCPTLATDSPYQNNGTDYDGTVDNQHEIKLTNSSFDEGIWSGSPDTYDGTADPGPGPTRYWFTENTDHPASFQASGPSTSAP